MIRDSISKGLDHDPNFRWRGEAVTRIENLSDFLFVAARWCNERGETDVKWVPGGER